MVLGESVLLNLGLSFLSVFIRKHCSTEEEGTYLKINGTCASVYNFTLPFCELKIVAL